MKNKTIKVGVVGVDSGQLMICDPCYINSEWKKRDFFEDRAIKNAKTGDVYLYGKDFTHYDEKPSGFDGKTYNELLADGVLVDAPIPNPYESEFSYAGACAATGSKASAGQLNFK